MIAAMPEETQDAAPPEQTPEAEPTTGQPWPTPHRIAGEAYGVKVRISTDSVEALERIERLTPPGWVGHDPAELDRAAEAEEAEIPHFTLVSYDGIEHELRRDTAVLTNSGLEIALEVLDAQLRAYIALHAPDRVFVHAGVVAHNGRAIVIPGKSFSGKTTLVAELVRAGATYYSDEYAVLDGEGLVSPYPKPLSIRGPNTLQHETEVEALGGVAGRDPVLLGLVVVAEYRLGAEWKPERLSPGDAVLALLANTVPAQERPQETMAALRAVIDRSGAVALAGERGEAADLVPELLAALPATP